MVHNPLPRRNVHPVRKKRLKFRYFFLMLLGLFVMCVSSYRYTGKLKVDQTSAARTAPANTVPADPEPAEPALDTSGEPVIVINARVRRGDTLYDILRANGFSDSSILAVSDREVEGIKPSKLVAGRQYRLLGKENRITEYQYEPDDERILRILFDTDPPRIVVDPIHYDIFRVPVSGTIRDSLFAAVEEVGEKSVLALALADLFAWQVDFFRDLRPGDTFTVAVDKYYREGKFVRYGDIIGARFINNGHTHNAFLFNPSDGHKDYFDETGGSLRKQFLKSPLKFRRISSGFSRGRLHPVTGKVTPHYGIDYAAPTGTPIRSVGDGRVLFRKRDAVNGRIIKIRHNGTYSTAYAHMNSFAKGIKKGSRVRQGQIIGYVGMTGRATGPHLHFAMYKHGRYVDPRRISVPRAKSIPDRDRPRFAKVVKETMLLLDGETREVAAGARNRTDVVP